MIQKERERLMQLSLNEKINYSKRIIKETLLRFAREELFITWTGGKDSTTMLWHYRETCRELGNLLPGVVFIDEGYVFEQILEFVDRLKRNWNIELYIIKNRDVSEKAKKIGDLIRVEDLNELNRREIIKLGFTDDYFPFEPESYIGNHLMKTAILNAFINEKKVKGLATAIRWDEQEARVHENYFSLRNDPKHTRIHPMLHFSEKDIWKVIHKQKIPFCDLYCKGYRSLGAKSTTYKISDIPAWEQDLENTSERDGRNQKKEHIMDKLRSLGYM
jgi:phosphoadenosine phosphosulfate reductase